LDYKTGGVKWLTNPQELLKFYPGLLEIANVSKIEIPFMKASENMDCDDWKKIAETARKLLNEPDVDGIIITHGTDFLHYTSSALAFSLQNLNKPVVLTYSQRSSDRASSDANLNLICAARAAISDIAEVMLVGHADLNDNFCYALPATKVRKMHSSRRDTFRPINDKPIAKIWADKIEVCRGYNARDNKKKVKVNAHFNSKVALIKFYPGQNPDILEYYLKNKYKGIVVEASGLGHVITEGRNDWIPKLKKTIKTGMVVCFAPQTIYGKLDPLVYSAGRELEKTGIIYLKDILPETALVKLSWVLGNSKMKKNVKTNMLKNFAGEFNSNLGQGEFLN
jgi:glutamyl-tRNA(Gln) amidotransferase subunit D